MCDPRWRDFDEAEFDENGDYFIGFEDGNTTHDSSDSNILNTDKLGLQYRFAVFQKHSNNLVKVVINLVQRRPLGMSAGKTGNKTNEQASLWAALNYR